jgi:di/tricarboxylate transporter
MWFVLVCFIFGTLMRKSGLGNRLAIYVFSIRNLLLIDAAILGLNALFSLVGMSSIFPKLALLMPLVTAIASLSMMSKEDPYITHVGLMINILANQTGMLIYSGFIFNPALGQLGGFHVDYTKWLQWFFVPTLVYNIVSFVVLYLLFLPRQGAKNLNRATILEKRKELGRLKRDEIKAIAWLSFAVLLWATSSLTGIDTGYAAALVAALLMMPGIGMIEFKEFIQETDWNMVFMLMGILAIGSLGVTGFAGWLWSHILPHRMPGNPMIALMIVSLLVEVLHVPLGSLGTTQALAVPSLAAYGPTIGMSKILLSIVAYMSIVGQSFFVYQNAALVAGQGFGFWRPKDIFKFGLAMFFVTPIVVGVVLYPWWVHLGWVR